MKTLPLNNNVLIEILLDYDGVSRSDANESLKRGVVVSVSVSSYHLTASSFGVIEDGFRKSIAQLIKPGTIVRWEEFAEGGQTFVEDGKTYALIPWWRLISYETKEETK